MQKMQERFTGNLKLACTGTALSPDPSLHNEAQFCWLRRREIFIFNTVDKIPTIREYTNNNSESLDKIHTAKVPRVVKDMESRIPDLLGRKKWQRIQLGRKDYNLRSTPWYTVAAAALAQTEVAQSFFAIPKVHHIYNEQGKRMTVEALLRGPDSDRWNRSMSI